MQHHIDIMDERVFQYAIHGGKAKDDPYFKDYFQASAFIDMDKEDITDDDFKHLEHARKYLKDNG